MRRSYVASLGAALLLVAAASRPAVSQEGGVIPAKAVVGTAVCVVVDTTPVDFGSIRFSTSDDTTQLFDGSSAVGAFDAGLVVSAPAPRNVESCASGNQFLQIHGTDAVNSADDLVWDLPAGPSDTGAHDHVCAGTASTNRYFLADGSDGLNHFAVYENFGPTWVLNASDTRQFLPELVPACAGSVGGGGAIFMDFVLTAAAAP